MKITHAVPGHVKASLVVDKIHSALFILFVLLIGCFLVFVQQIAWEYVYLTIGNLRSDHL